MAKTNSSFINMVLTLLIVSSISALSLGAIFNVTKEPIAKAKREKLKKAIKQVVPAFDTIYSETVFSEGARDSIYIYKAMLGNEHIGTAIKTYTDDGFSGRIWIMVGFLPDKSIYNTSVLEHKETPGLGDKMSIKKSEWCLQFKGINPETNKLMLSKDGGDIDAITAATISSRAFCDAAQRGYDHLK